MSKVDALSSQALADAALYDAGFEDGKASVSSGGISPEQEQADINASVEAAVAPLNDQIAALQLAKAEEDALLASVKDLAAKLLLALG